VEIQSVQASLASSLNSIDTAPYTAACSKANVPLAHWLNHYQE
jgi:hypothetical protein